MQSIAYIALGSNLGDREAIMASAIESLNSTQGLHVTASSSFIETDPAPGSMPADQARFINAVIAVRASLCPADLLGCCLAIERAHGRKRMAGERWGPRTLDLDLLLYDALVIDRPGLVLPHPRMHEREFVLRPLSEIAPLALHPLLGKTIQCLLDEVVARPARIA